MRPVSSFAAACAGARCCSLLPPYTLNRAAREAIRRSLCELQTRGVSYRVVPLVSDESAWYRPGMEMPRMKLGAGGQSLEHHVRANSSRTAKNSAFVGALTTRVLLRLSFGNPSQDERRDTLLGQFRLRVRDIAQGPDERDLPGHRTQLRRGERRRNDPADRTGRVTPILRSVGHRVPAGLGRQSGKARPGPRFHWPAHQARCDRVPLNDARRDDRLHRRDRRARLQPR